MTHPTNPPPPPQALPCNGFGITALVLALTGLVFGLTPLTGFLALILGMVAVVFGFLGWSNHRAGIATNGTMAGFGAVAGVIAIVLGLAGMSIMFDAVDRLGRNLQSSQPVPRFPGSLIHDFTAVPLPSPSDFTIKTTVLSKSCTPTYGCMVTYTVDPTYTGSAPLPGRPFTVIYEVTGGDYGPRTDNFTITRGGTVSVTGSSLTRMSSSGASLTATATGVSGS